MIFIQIYFCSAEYIDVSEEEKAARLYAMEYNKEIEQDKARAVAASWNYMSNLTAENRAIFDDVLAEIGAKKKVKKQQIVSI